MPDKLIIRVIEVIMSDLQELKDFDIFFYYGKNSLENETKSDIFQNILQPERSLLYNRSQDSSGVRRFENTPNTIQIKILLPFAIVNSLAKRNLTVTNGDKETIDRRIAVSQSTVRLEQNQGNVNLSVFYIPFSTLKPEELNYKLGV
jgi:hypothetical protein